MTALEDRLRIQAAKATLRANGWTDDEIDAVFAGIHRELLAQEIERVAEITAQRR